MTAEHHAVREYVVSTLARAERPLPPTEIASELGLSLTRVTEILEELEPRLFFLVRNGAGEVAWAFPVTVEETPHRMTLSTGAKTLGACAEDTVAAAFILGHLLGQSLSSDVDTICGQSGRPIRFAVTSDLEWRTRDGDSAPVLFVPSVNWSEFRGANILDHY